MEPHIAHEPIPCAKAELEITIIIRVSSSLEIMNALWATEISIAEPFFSRLMLSRHFLAALSALAANVRTHFHHLVVAHALTIFRALQTGISTNAAYSSVELRIPHHEVSRGSANVGAGGEYLNVISLGVHSAFF